MVSKVDIFLFISKTIICVVYVDDFSFWERSKSEINNVMNSFKEDEPSSNWEHSNEELVSDFFGIDIKKSDYGGFQFFKLDRYENSWKPQGWSIVMG